MAPQTSYAINMPVASYPGQIADTMTKDILSAQAVVAAVAYGVLVVRDEANTAGFDQLAAKVPASAADITNPGSAMGIVAADQARAQDPSVAVPTYPILSSLHVLKVGRIWVKSETAVTDGQPVYARYSANGPLTQLGALRADADSAHAAVVPDAIWIGTTTAPGYAVVEIAVL